MRVVFFGTPAFAVPSLQALLAAGVDVPLVVTQPDRARGRSHSTLLPPPVKEAALAAGLEVAQPERPRGDVFVAQLRAARADLGVVVAYGHLLRPEILAIPRLGLVNVHASLLPRWRGAAPIQWSVLAGDRETGVAIMRLEEGLDSGGVWLERRIPIRDEDTSGSLFFTLAALGADALIDAMPRIAAGDAPTPQDPAGVTLAPKIDRDLARVLWDDDARAVSCRVRAMDPAPGAWATLATQDVKLFGPVIHPDLHGPAGMVLEAGARLVIACGRGAVEIAEVQPAGKRRMAAAEWTRGGGVAAGARFA